MLQIPRWPQSGERERQLLDEVLSSDQWGGFHPFVSQFESAFASFQHCAHGVASVNGTVTLEVMLQALDIGPGDEVIVPAISFISTATAVNRVGATPVFVDIEPYTFNIDPACAEAAISPKTKAILAVHFGGPLAQIERLEEICTRHNILLLEDAAHAQGSEWKQRRAGSFGRASSFSFQNGKVITAGEGGALLTNDSDLAARLRSLINQGRRPGYTFFHHFELGSNARITGLQAAVLLAQLERLPSQIELRTRNAALLFQALADVEEVRWQEVPPEVNSNCWYLMLGMTPERDAFHKALTAQGVPCTPFYPHTLYRNPLYQNGGCRVTPCPNAEARIRDAFWLSHRVLMADEDTTLQIAQAIKAAVPRKVLA